MNRFLGRTWLAALLVGALAVGCEEIAEAIGDQDAGAAGGGGSDGGAAGADGEDGGVAGQDGGVAGQDGGDGSAGEDGAPPACTEDSDCDAGQHCDAGVCVPDVAPCAVDDDCDPGEQCIEGDCVPEALDCAEDADCDDGETCADGFCVAGPDDCIDDTDCSDGELCVDGLCTPEEPPCFEDADCGPGAMCLEGECIADVMECAEDADCLPGDLCVAGFCVPDGLECVGDAGCDEGMVCEEGFCVPEIVECIDDMGCPDGEVCEGGICVPDAIQCMDDAGCDEGEVCVGGVCLPEGFECVDDGGCAEFELCRGGFCVAADCFEDADCDVGEMCVDGFCEAGVIVCVDDADCDEGDVCVEGMCQPDLGALCDDVPAILLDAPANGETAGPGMSAGSCGGPQASPEAVYVFAAPDDGVYCVSLDGSAYDTVLYLRSGCADPESELACNDDNQAVTDGLESAIEIELGAADSIFIFVDGFTGGAPNNGAYTLAVTAGECPLAPQCEVDDDCFGAELCIDQQCVPGNCREDGDCAENQDGPFCQEQFCAACREDADCAENPNGAICLDNACVACLEDADCAENEAGAICLDNACVACLDDADCGEAQACFENACYDMPELGTCEAPRVGALGESRGFTRGEGVNGAVCGGDVASPEDIYVFAFPAPGQYCLNLSGSGFDTVLYVRATCDDPASELDCNDDNHAITGGTWSALTLEAEAETSYYVYVDGYTGFGGDTNGGPYTLTVSEGPCLPPPDCAEDVDCDAGELCINERCVRANCRENGDCVEHEDGPFCAENQCGACVEDADCGEGGGVCVDRACVACREDANCAEGEGCVDGECVPAPAMGICAEPRSIEGEALGLTRGVTAHEGSCGGGAAPEDIFVYAPVAGGEICISLAGSSYDTVLYVRTQCDGVDTEVVCNDDNQAVTGGLQSAVTLAVDAETHYFVFVDGFGARGGAFVLNVSDGPCAEPACFVDFDCDEGQICDPETSTCIDAPQ